MLLKDNSYFYPKKKQNLANFYLNIKSSFYQVIYLALVSRKLSDNLPSFNVQNTNGKVIQSKSQNATSKINTQVLIKNQQTFN